MAASPYSRDPLERMFSNLRAEYIGKVDGDVLTRTLREIHLHAERLGILNKPHLVEHAIRDVLSDHVTNRSPRGRSR